MQSTSASARRWITTALGTVGSGKWGGRWSGGAGQAMGGTFGFAAAKSSLSALGAFTARACGLEALV